MAISEPTLIGTINNTSSTSALSITVPAGGVPAGALVVVVATKSLSATITAADSESNTYNVRKNQKEAIDSHTVVILDSILAKSLASGKTITVTFGGTFSSKTAQAYYWTGVASFQEAVGASSGFPHTQPMNPGNVTAAKAGSLVIGGYVYNNTTSVVWTPVLGYATLSSIAPTNNRASAVSGIRESGTQSPQTTAVATGSSFAAVAAVYNPAEEEARSRRGVVV